MQSQLYTVQLNFIMITINTWINFDSISGSHYEKKLYLICFPFSNYHLRMKVGWLQSYNNDNCTVIFQHYTTTFIIQMITIVLVNFCIKHTSIYINFHGPVLYIPYFGNCIPLLILKNFSLSRLSLSIIALIKKKAI